MMRFSNYISRGSVLVYTIILHPEFAIVPIATSIISPNEKDVFSGFEKPFIYEFKTFSLAANFLHVIWLL